VLAHQTGRRQSHRVCVAASSRGSGLAAAPVASAELMNAFLRVFMGWQRSFDVGRVHTGSTVLGV